ncbi:peptidase [Thioalkalivibrio sp. XN8]|uniref:peptidase n=1 Tax=Thioalkalivibrio sp. XN8 TaxID=2712863 RepID=UPI0013ECBBF9|nr:peptidase [Thioalkalivibrio sp. XN8]NGP54004.1 peptidase [Thioalkalivibrio sp. XN8]
MTYCVALAVERGLVFASDSRTNAGPDQVSVFGKMHVLLEAADRFFVLLSAGNLGTTQAVRTRIRHDLEFDRRPNLRTVQSMAEAAEYLGGINAEQGRKHAEGGEPDTAMTATFILGGQIRGRAPGIFLVYSEGNYIRASSQTPFLQIGELKYGKPILDRLVKPDLELDDAARVMLLSMDATMRSNVTVGPPIEVLIYDPARPQLVRHMIFGPDDDYLRELGRAWQGYVEKAFSVLPPLPPRPAELLRVVDE